MSVYVSSLLTATAATVNADPASTRTWQWQRNGVDIPGATNSTYSAAVADIGANIAVVQAEANFLGTNNATSASVGPVVAFSPIALFQDGSQGWWYDDDDLTTLFQDSAGKTPVTAVEQFVGLQLDKSKGLVLGPELVVNGDGTSTTGWSTFGTVTSFASVSGVLQITTPDSRGSEGVRQVLSSLVAGKTYQVSVSLRIANTPVANQTASLRWANGNVTSGFTTFVLTTSSSMTTLSGVFSPSETTATIALVNGGLSTSGGGPFVTEFDNISVRELPGNHRYAPASGNRPIWSKRVNLLTKTEQFDDAVWVKSFSAITANATTAPDGTLTADRVEATGIAPSVQQDVVVNSTSVTLSAYFKKGTGATSANVLLIRNQTLASNLVAARVNLDTGAITYLAGSSGAVSEDAGNGWWKLTLTAGITYGNTVRAGILGGYSATIGDFSYIWGADLRPANQATGLLPLYQRVNTSTDYETTGFPGYLKADGVDDFLQTNSIDFSAGPTNPPLGPELVVNGDGTTLTGWTSVNDASCTTAVSGGQFVLTTVAGGGARLRQTIPVTAGRAYRITGFVQANNNSAAGALQVWGTGYGSGDLYASAQVVNGTVSATVTATSANLYLQLNAFNSSSGITNYYDNISVKEITNANLGADKITLCAGVRKLSDAARAMVTELGADVTQSFQFNAPSAAATTYSFASRGSAAASSAVYSNSAVAAPITNVATGIGDISGDSAILRINGTQVATSTTDQGTGNYGNLPAYFFHRNTSPATLRFNGNEYGNIAVGKLLTADQLTALETYMNGLTKAY